MKTNHYKIKNSIEKLLDEKSTLFLDKKEQKQIQRILKKKQYQIFIPYEDADKVILYKESLPHIVLFKIKCHDKIRHQDVLGSVLSLGIDSSYIGDIVFYQESFYIYVLNEISAFLKNNWINIAKYKIKLIEEDLSVLQDYKKEYEELEIQVSSLRVDNVLSSLCNLSRKQISEKIKNKEVFVNDEILTKNFCFLKENDTFSIRKYGKFKYKNIKKETKKQKLIIEVLKYI